MKRFGNALVRQRRWKKDGNNDEEIKRKQEAAFARMLERKQNEQLENRMNSVSYTHGRKVQRKQYDYQAVQENIYDYVVVGSGYGGSIFALRMAQKGYSVLLLEQGRAWDGEAPNDDWELWGTRWNPLFKMSGKKHTRSLGPVVVECGVGLGGSSLDHVAHLSTPDPSVFSEGEWADILSETEMTPHYNKVKKMLGVTTQPFFTENDRLFAEAARDLGLKEPENATCAIFFGKQKAREMKRMTSVEAREAMLKKLPYSNVEQGDNVDRTEHTTRRQALQRRDLFTDGETQARGRVVWGDPYFDGIGPNRSPCTSCGLCSTGCAPNAKNSLPNNYLFLAENRYNSSIMTATRANAVRYLGEPTDDDDSRYLLEVEQKEEVQRSFFRNIISDTKYLKPKKLRIKSRNVAICCGTVETNKLLLKMKHDPLGLPELSDEVGRGVRAPHTSTVTCTALDDTDEGTPYGRTFSAGVTTTTVLHTENGRIEARRFGPSCSFSRFAYWPSVSGGAGGAVKSFFGMLRNMPSPFGTFRWLTRGDWSGTTLLFREVRDCTGSMTVGLKGNNLKVIHTEGEEVSAAPEHAAKIAAKFNATLDGSVVATHLVEGVLGKSKVDDITGGACMGKVVGPNNEVYKYPGLFVVDGAAIGGNLHGVDSALTVGAMAERAASMIPVSNEGSSEPHLYDHIPWSSVEMKDKGHL
eukprot:TRINITY_DN20142_c0_g1_i1.p1 TRINITY_DN20142_c0_g1~~TRINITY_DN20142_c0_g1_i1.p1  ORF type:complete len:695 (+),score=184.26 TRINITY_DN20142_c0_g1_i1:32-2116(+)